MAGGVPALLTFVGLRFGDDRMESGGRVRV